jgi:hypothetical protein
MVRRVRVGVVVFGIAVLIVPHSCRETRRRASGDAS